MKNLEINSNSIDNLIQQIKMVKTYYVQQNKTKKKHIKISKGAQFNFSPKKRQSHSMQYSSVTSSPPKGYHYRFLSTFVNIKDARYRIGPNAGTYNLKNIQFPDICSKTNTPKLKFNPQNSHFTQSLDQRVIPSKQVDRTYVKQSWNKFTNLHSINKSVHIIEEINKKIKKISKKPNKDIITQQNIQGWKSFYHQDDQMNLPKN